MAIGPNECLPVAKNETQQFIIGMYNAYKNGIVPSEYRKQLVGDLRIINMIEGTLNNKMEREKAMADLLALNKNKYGGM